MKLNKITDLNKSLVLVDEPVDKSWGIKNDPIASISLSMSRCKDKERLTAMYEKFITFYPTVKNYNFCKENYSCGSVVIRVDEENRLLFEMYNEEGNRLDNISYITCRLDENYSIEYVQQRSTKLLFNFYYH